MISGSGEDEDKLKQLSKDLRVEECLTFLGYRNDIQNLMSQLDLIVLSSLWEELPLTPIEAFSVGKTLIATAVDGTVEIVRDGIDGYLIPARNPHIIAEKIIELESDTHTMKEFEKEAIKRYTDNFSYGQLADRYKLYYENVK